MQAKSKTDETLRKTLSAEQIRIAKHKGTEAPFSGKYVHETAQGTYCCAVCGQELFASEAKYDSGSGWPSFWDVVKKRNVRLVRDSSHGMERTEVQCARCGAHLGHVFPDGPQPTGQRYCVNSAVLELVRQSRHSDTAVARG